jgi:hypothetical protein
MKMRKTMILVLGAALLLLAGCAARTAAQPSDEGSHLDAESYAEAYGLSPEEAAGRLNAQDDVGGLQERLAREEADTFGGLWIEHEPAYRVVVAFTEDAAATLARYVEGTSLQGIAVAREVAFTQAELESAQAATLALLQRIGSRADTGLDIRQNCVALYVAEQAAFEAKLTAAGESLPEGVCIEQVGPYPEAPPLEAVPGFHFPRQDPPEGVGAEMAALMIGELVEVDGCLRVRWQAGDPGSLVIWPYDHTLTLDDDGRPEVRDGSGTVVARLGDTVELGGGQSPGLPANLADAVPDNCPGPYWFAARGISTSE